MVVTINLWGGGRVMLQLSYVGIAFSLVFYVVFGMAVRFMDLTKKARNKARLKILIFSMSVFAISGTAAGVLNIRLGHYFYGVALLLFSIFATVFVSSILFELHQINARVRMRRFMVLFDVVDRYISEGKTNDEIMEYLTQIQKLTVKEATDFLTFISQPDNHQFLADVNSKIQEKKMLAKAESEFYR